MDDLFSEFEISSQKKEIAKGILLSFLNIDQKTIKDIINLNVIDVEEGLEDSLKFFIAAKKAEKIFYGIVEAIKKQAANDLRLGKQETYEKYGCKITKEEMGVKYDYKHCNDEMFNDLLSMVDIRTKFLKALQNPVEEHDEETGEVKTILPPIRTSTEGLKVSIK